VVILTVFCYKIVFQKAMEFASTVRAKRTDNSWPPVGAQEFFYFWAPTRDR
jgi:hypothetical protein